MNKYMLITIAVCALVCSGCETKAGTGFLAGGASGAVIGGVAGGGVGAAIGAGAGAVTGGLIGAYLDSRDQQRLEQEDATTAKRIDKGQKLSVSDVIAMHNAKISDDKIIKILRDTDSRFKLTTRDIDKLHRAGVSNSVINYMLRS